MSEEINKFLHEKLMGGCWHENETEIKISHHLIRKRRESISTCKKCGQKNQSNWSYTEHIGLAFKVVDAMKEKGFLFAADNRHPEGHWAEFATEGYERGGQATGDSFAEAIARAAKAALEGEK